MRTFQSLCQWAATGYLLSKEYGVCVVATEGTDTAMVLNVKTTCSKVPVRSSAYTFLDEMGGFNFQEIFVALQTYTRSSVAKKSSVLT